MNLARYRGRMLFSLAGGAVVLLGLLIYGDLPQTIAALSRFDARYLAPIVGLTLANYLVRYLKWHYYIRLLGARSVNKVDSLLIFFSGLSMTVTPGKVGEWLKIYLLRSASGVPFSRSAPIILAERLTDGLALLVLASGGIIVFGLGWEVLVGTLLFASVVVGVSQVRPLAIWGLEIGERLPFISSRIHHFREFYEGSYILFRGPTLALAIFLGVVSWSGECLAFYLVLVALGVEPSWFLILQSAFILSASTLAGALLLTPGGLGVAEGGIAGMTQVLVGTSSVVAAAGTILIRVCTLWFGVAVGTLTLLLFSRRLEHVEPPIVIVPNTGIVEQT